MCHNYFEYWVIMFSWESIVGKERFPLGKDICSQFFAVDYCRQVLLYRNGINVTKTHYFQNQSMCEIGPGSRLKFHTSVFLVFP